MFFVIISRECVAGLHDDDHDDDNHGGGVQFRFVLFCHVLFSLVFGGIKTLDFTCGHKKETHTRTLIIARIKKKAWTQGLDSVPNTSHRKRLRRRRSSDSRRRRS